MLNITVTPAASLEPVHALYRECGYGGGVSKADTTLVAHVGGELAAAVRICFEQGVTVLRGMQVRRAFQRQGVGTNLLGACLPFLDHNTSYCLPYTHLVSFYGAAGFVVVQSSEAPDFLAERAAAYKTSGQSVLVMQREVPNLALESDGPDTARFVI